jgi:hypothetical protein
MPDNMTLAEQVLHTTVRLEGRLGPNVKVGTGVLFGWKERVFVVTNKHAIKDVDTGYFSLLAGQTTTEGTAPRFGQNVSIPYSERDFVGHPNPAIDVAVANISERLNTLISEGNPPFYRAVSNAQLLTQEQLDKFVGPIEDVLMVGYPEGLWDSVNILPVVRRGITATPFKIDFNGRPVFLVDAAVCRGSSGSPVYLYRVGSYSDSSGSIHIGSLFGFIGIVSSAYTYRDGEVRYVDIPTMRVPMYVPNQLMNLGIVEKPVSIIEAVEHYLELAQAE